MKFLNLKNNRQKGISSIVGGIFFLVLMTSGFTVYYVAIDTQSQMLDVQQIIADTEVAKIQEKFVVAASSDPGDNNRLSIQVVNTGNNPIEIADVWIINKTNANEPATRYDDLDFRDVSIPIGYSGNVLENYPTPLYLTPEIYGIKVISSLGTIKTVEYDVNGGSNVLNAQMVAIPQDVRFGENVTIALIVTNAAQTQMTDVQVNLPLDVNPNQCVTTPNLIFGGPTTLYSSQSTMFFWDCVIKPPIGNTITFTASARGLLSGVLVNSNPASDSIIVRDFSSGGDETIIKDELFGKPQLLLIFPNPVGWDNNDKALWGVNVANPTDQSIDVSKVVIVAVSPRATSSDKIFAPNCHTLSSPLNPTTVPPTTAKWTCPESNQLQWKDVTNPQTIQPRSVFPFLVKIGTEGIGSTTGEANNIPIHTTVFTTLGQFGKSGYVSTMTETQVAMPNVYLSRVPGSANPADMLGEIRGITTGTTVIFNAILADMETSEDYEINSGSRMIINIPREWNYNALISHPGFNTPSVQTFPDGSTQIIGVLEDPLDGDDDITATIRFSATAPIITTAKMYVMHILADGTATGLGGSDFTIGPISESVLQVCPTTGCP